MSEKTKKILKICGLLLLTLLVSGLGYIVLNSLWLILCIIVPIFLLKLSLKHVFCTLITLFTVFFTAALAYYAQGDVCCGSTDYFFTFLKSHLGKGIFSSKIPYICCIFAYIAFLVGIKGKEISHLKLSNFGKFGLYFTTVILIIYEILYFRQEWIFGLYIVISAITLGILYSADDKAKKDIKQAITYICALPVVLFGALWGIITYEEYFYPPHIDIEFFADSIDSSGDNINKQQILNQVFASCLQQHSNNFKYKHNRHVSASRKDKYAEDLKSCTKTKFHEMINKKG